MTEPEGIRTLNIRIDSPVRNAPGAIENADFDDERTTGAPNDPDLAAVIEAWPTLPGPLRAGILAMVRAAIPGDAEGDPG